MARQIRPQAERYTGARLALPDHNQSIFLFASMDADPTKAYNQKDATGFIRFNALRLKVAAEVQRKK